MYVFFARKSDGCKTPFFDRDWDTKTEGFLLLLLFSGVLIGSIFGTYSERTDWLALPLFSCDYALPRSFPAWYLASARYFLCLLAAATTYFGIVLVPALVLLRGYVLGSAAAAAFASASYHGLLSAFLTCGVSAIVTLPMLLIAANDSFQSSRTMIRLRLGQQETPGIRPVFLRRCLLCMLFVLLDALYCGCILPHLRF